MIPLQCTCGVKLNLPDQLAGKQGPCPNCGAMLNIPASASPTVPSSSPPPAAAAPEPAPSKPTIASTETSPAAAKNTTAKNTTAKNATAKNATAKNATAKNATASTQSMVAPAGLASPLAKPAPSSRGAWRLPVEEQQPNEPPPLSQPPPLGAKPQVWSRNSMLMVAVGSVAVVVVLVLILSLFSGGGDDTESPVVQGGGDPREASTNPNPPAVPISANKNDGPQRLGASEVSTSPPTEPPSPPPPNTSVQTPRVQINPDVKPVLPAPKRETANGPRSLSGASQQFDDGRCRIIQSSHGVRIPPAATIIEVDGLLLPVTNLSELQASPAPVLLLPRRAHVVRFNRSDRLIEVKIARDFVDTYDEMRSYFGVPGKVQTQLLVMRGARAMDVHGAPFLLNFLGADYIHRNQWEAAERKYRRALRVNPTFSPAHLNLAHCLAHRKANAEAIREIQLAEAFNVGDVYGISTGIFALKVQLEVASVDNEDQRPVEFFSDVYVSLEPLSEEDRRIVAFMQAASRYATRDEARAKILNNLAVHFAESGRPTLALEYFRGALKALKVSGPDRFALRAECWGT